MNKKHILLIVIFLALFYFDANPLIYRPIMNLNILSMQETKAVVINEKDVTSRKMGNSPGIFSYYYEFWLNGKFYKNPTYDEKYKIGDTILIEYSKRFPFINRIPPKK